MSEKSNVKSAERGTRTLQPLVGLLDRGFMTSNSDGYNGKYWVQINFQTLEEMQACYTALIEMANREITCGGEE